MTPSPPVILVTGAHGQVGHALLSALAPLGRVVATVMGEGSHIPVPVMRADLSQADQVRALVREIQPQVIVNAAAYTAVDQAERERDRAYAVNAEAPRILAEEARAKDLTLIHYSTDYVFDGSGTQPRTEDAPVGPLSIYGASKRAGEEAILASGAHALILRTSWVFSHHGHNFVKTMLRLGAEREELKIVADQWGAPTQADFLAAMTARALRQGWSKDQCGIYHLCNGGETTWHGFATEIFRLAHSLGFSLKVQSVRPIATSDYPTPARRPLNSRLNCGKFKQAFGVSSWPDWPDALADTMQHLRPK